MFDNASIIIVHITMSYNILLLLTAKHPIPIMVLGTPLIEYDHSCSHGKRYIHTLFV